METPWFEWDLPSRRRRLHFSLMLLGWEEGSRCLMGGGRLDPRQPVSFSQDLHHAGDG